MNTDKLRILHFIPSLSFRTGGMGGYVQLLDKGIGDSAKLFVACYPSRDELPTEHATIVDVPPMTLFGKRCRHVFEYILDTLRPDIVHCHGCWLPVDAMTVLWAKKKGYKVVLTPHGMLEPYVMKRNWWTKKVPALLLYQRKALQRADCLVATAEQERENILKLGYNDRVAVVPIGLDVNDIVMKSSWQRTKKIVFLSRIHEKKGIEFLLEAWAELLNEEKKKTETTDNASHSSLLELPSCTIYIYGMGEEGYISQLQQQAEQLGISEHVQFAGSVQGEEKWRVLREADLFVLPTHSENFGIAVAEALASGTPVITTQGTPWQDIADNDCGWWVPVGKEPLKKALRSFLHKSESELEQMGRNGRRLIETKFSTASMAERMISLYKEILR